MVVAAAVSGPSPTRTPGLATRPDAAQAADPGRHPEGGAGRDGRAHPQVHEPNQPGQAMFLIPGPVEAGGRAVPPREVLDGPQQRAGTHGTSRVALVEAHAVLAGMLPRVIHAAQYGGADRPG